MKSSHNTKSSEHAPAIVQRWESEKLLVIRFSESAGALMQGLECGITRAAAAAAAEMQCSVHKH